LARNEVGEFELVLGNRQLVSVFLIVVILLGVFFSMGYIVGRNSTPADTAKNATPAKPIVVPKPTDQDATPPASDSASKDSASKDTESTDSTKPSPSASAAPTPTAIPLPPPEEKQKPSPMDKPKPAEKPAVKPAEKANDAPRMAISEPAPGQYWQVLAGERPDAELIAEALTKKGMKALLAPAPKEGYYRVLVGPFSDPANMAEIRTSLESAGFKNPIVRKY
jgi:cell division protein FtsN